MNIGQLVGERMRVEEPTIVQSMGMMPLIAMNHVNEISPLLLLDEALEKGFAHITEAGEEGHVPFLLLRNKGTMPILILDGEELVGGKQNRVVNTTILAPPGCELTIPVACMEQGRWHLKSAAFGSGEAIFRARSRAQQKAGVTETLQRHCSFSGNQHMVWDEVRCSLAQTDAASPTADFREARRSVSDRIEAYVNSVKPLAEQIGAVFYSPQGVIGCELLATADLFARAFAKIIRSFAFEVLEQPAMAEDGAEAPRIWLQKVMSAPVVTRPSPGAGEDLRIASRDVIGSGLIWHNQLLHLSCFPQNQPASDTGHENRSTRQTASARKKRMQTS